MVHTARHALLVATVFVVPRAAAFATEPVPDHLVVLEPWGNWGRWQTPGQWNFYGYWHEMEAASDGKYWGNAFRPELSSATLFEERRVRADSSHSSTARAQGGRRSGAAADAWW